jgi:hypothetical protein
MVESVAPTVCLSVCLSGLCVCVSVGWPVCGGVSNVTRLGVDILLGLGVVFSMSQ